jgi:hypothetical protein
MMVNVYHVSIHVKIRLTVWRALYTPRYRPVCLFGSRVSASEYHLSQTVGKAKKNAHAALSEMNMTDAYFPFVRK